VLVPRIVDHQERRHAVTAVAADLVARRGRNALTVRNVAEAAGCSTKVVSHYFDDMADLLHQIYDHAADRARARIDAVVANDPADVEGLIEAVLPLDDERRDDWRVWFAFWSEALATAEFAQDQRERARTTAERIRSSLHRLRADGRLSASVDVETAADRLSALIPGVAAHAVFDPAGWTASRQRRVLRDELVALGIEPGGSDPHDE
jgi:AcrR family transcriptional regulator